MHVASDLSEPDASDLKLRLARHACLGLGRLMLQHEIQRFDSRRGEPQFATLGKNAL
ncbi:hypothetical protein Ga0061069_107162 [Thiomonas bhubaneswarensis]|uniref:Uncharacterized protein n=1 Tax=Thiomonas bhubaneswarensis TaxID=339866 RepID=A0A0K6I694_9BURK|nr:hypothetical protein Ga0061069_107162 [Thiomonas bhubaneswarensis]